MRFRIPNVAPARAVPLAVADRDRRPGEPDEPPPEPLDEEPLIPRPGPRARRGGCTGLAPGPAVLVGPPAIVHAGRRGDPPRGGERQRSRQRRARRHAQERDPLVKVRPCAWGAGAPRAPFLAIGAPLSEDRTGIPDDLPPIRRGQGRTSRSRRPAESGPGCTRSAPRTTGRRDGFKQCLD